MDNGSSESSYYHVNTETKEHIVVDSMQLTENDKLEVKDEMNDQSWSIADNGSAESSYHQENTGVNREVMDLIEMLKKQIKEGNGESSTEDWSDVVETAGEDGSDVEKAEEDGIDDDDEAKQQTESDAEEEELSNEKTNAVDNKSKELRAEGKDYVVHEGDVMLFRFNV